MPQRPPPRVAPTFARLRRLEDAAARWVFLGCAAGAVAGFALIFVFVLRGGLPVLFDPRVHAEVQLGSLFGTPIWQPVSEIPKYGILPLLAGTAKVVLIALLFAVPISVCAALFASEFASGQAREWIKPAVEILAGIIVLIVPRFGGLLVAGWLGGIILSLLLVGCYGDIALRDFGLLLGALALFRLAGTQQAHGDDGLAERKASSAGPVARSFEHRPST